MLFLKSANPILLTILEMKLDNEQELSESELTVGRGDVGHSVDDIECLQSGVPGWWRNGFLASLLFFPLYMFYYHNGTAGRTAMDSFDRSLASNMELQFAQLGELSMDGKSIRRFLADDSWLQVGKSIFKTNCASCHGSNGGGVIGPNLCDDSYKNIRELDDFINVLLNGAGGGSMPAWKGKLNETQIVLVSSYAASLRGTNPAGGKPPEGTEIAPW